MIDSEEIRLYRKVMEGGTMKVSVLFDKLMNKEEVTIQTNPANSEIAHCLENYLKKGSKLTVINAKNNRKLQVDMHSILAFQSEGHMCSVKMKSSELYLINKRLKELECLAEKQLVKINNQTIINLDEVVEFSPAPNARLEVLMSDQSSYFVNRHYVKTIKERLSW
ncbi:DNA-binding protein [Bacillaceae bacterium SAOS 7]|nr:DNA-binding protein [Bacillaceae bacterium SAS-127]PAQ16431.1 DNA-binding protein [Bacillaceae bacterium SAOS 7]